MHHFKLQYWFTFAKRKRKHNILQKKNLITKACTIRLDHTLLLLKKLKIKPRKIPILSIFYQNSYSSSNIACLLFVCVKKPLSIRKRTSYTGVKRYNCKAEAVSFSLPCQALCVPGPGLCQVSRRGVVRRWISPKGRCAARRANARTFHVRLAISTRSAGTVCTGTGSILTLSRRAVRVACNNCMLLVFTLTSLQLYYQG